MVFKQCIKVSFFFKSFTETNFEVARMVKFVKPKFKHEVVVILAF